MTLGYTMSMLYIPGHLTPKGNAGLFDSQLGNNGAQTDLVTHLPLKDDTSSERRPAPMPQPGMPSKDTRPGIFDKFSETISIWNPWGKAQSDRARPYDDEDSVEDFRAGNHTHHQYPRIGKVTILTGRDNQVYERAIRTHELHNQLHGYSFHTLRESLLNGVWSKPAYILSVMLRELAKPKAERLEWLLWIDADTIILNPYIPAGIFLPPPGWDDVHCLVCNDWNGLNNGVFLIRVHSWSVDLLAAVVSYPYYRPDDELLFRDQSAMAELLKTPKFLKHTAIVPQRWFNAYQGEVNETVAPFQVRRGDLLVHFAGVMDRLGRMDYWLTRVEEHDPEWEMELKYTSYPSEIKDYWSDMSRLRNSHRAEVAEARSSMEKLKSDVQKKLDEFRGRVEEVPRKRIEQEIEHADNVLRDPFLGDDVDSIHMTIDILKTVGLIVRSVLKCPLTESDLATFARANRIEKQIPHKRMSRCYLQG